MSIFDNSELLFHSPWWENVKSIEEDKSIRKLNFLKYRYEHPLLHEYPLKKDAVLTLRGPRQIGKTTLVKQIISKLLSSHINSRNIFFYPCDRKVHFTEIYDLVKQYIEQIRLESKERVYVFLDEISYVPQWQRAIKSLADDGLLENVSALLTGSNAIDLKISSERLPGRTGEYFLPEKNFLPLSFKEFYGLVAKDEKEFSTSKINRYKKYFGEYLLTGGFPAVINEYYEKGYIEPLTYEIYTKWVEGDIYKQGRIPEIMYQIVENIDKNLGSRLSYVSLAQDSGVASQQTVQDYLNILELEFVLFKASFFSIPEKRIESKKNKKLYFIDPFIHGALIAKARGYYDDPFAYIKKRYQLDRYFNNVVEQVLGYNILKRFGKIFYYHNSKSEEIDFVVRDKDNLKAFEIKNSIKFDVQKYQMMNVDKYLNEGIKILNPSREMEVEGVKAESFFRFLLEE